MQAGSAKPDYSSANGRVAIEELHGRLGDHLLSISHLFLLDLNMPLVNGIEFLDCLRSDPCFNESIVFVLTTSDMPQDIHAAFQRYVAGYLVKGRLGDQLLGLTELLTTYFQAVDFYT